MRIEFAAAAALLLLGAGPAAAGPPEDLAGIIKSYLGMSLPSDWNGIENLADIVWAPLPPTELQHCQPNGDCFTREGTATLGVGPLRVVASGAGTLVANFRFDNLAAPMGEAALVAALTQAGLGPELARCPIGPGTGTSWYRLKNAERTLGVLSIAPAGAGRLGESFSLSLGDELPVLDPDYLAVYSETCAPGMERRSVATVKPHQRLAQTLVTLLAQAGGAGPYDWKSLAALPTEIAWLDDGPRPMDLSARNDANPVALSGLVAYGGRKFSVLASGTPAQVKTIYFEEQGLHPYGEHLLGAVYEQGVAVRVARCGPVYTQSTHTWYSLTGPRTRPAMVLQSIRYDGERVQDSYQLRLDGSLPARDPRDRDPGAQGC